MIELIIFVAYIVFTLIFMLVGLLGRRGDAKYALFPFLGGIVGATGFVQLGQDGILVTDTAFNSSGNLLSSGISPYPIDLILVFMFIIAFLLTIIIAWGQ